MTQAEYAKAYREAKKRLSFIEKEVKDRLLDVYIEAGLLVSDKVKAATAKELSEYTINGLRSIDDQIFRSADRIAQAVEENLPFAITESYKKYSEAEIQYIYDIAKDIDGTGITKIGLSNVAVRINDNLVREVFNLQFPDKTTYSQRIWSGLNSKGLPTSVHSDFQYRIKNVINLGTVQGRDPIKIAEDLSVYLKDGKTKLVQRYGKLKKGSSAFKRRISERVDYRALRLVRSTQNAAMQLASVRVAELNPAKTGYYDWHKTNGNPIDPNPASNASGMRCIDLEAGNPYTAETIPAYQHPNCSCWIEPHVMSNRELTDDLINFVNGDDNYITEWYMNSYLPSQP